MNLSVESRSFRRPSSGFPALLTRLLVVGYLALILSASAAAVDDVIAPLFTLTDSSTAPNGAWSWFEDQRAIIDASDPNNVLLLASTVSSAANGDLESGDVDLLWRNLNTGQQGEFELQNRLERDDHDSAALYLRPDGHYLAMYSRHISDSLTRWRISTNPHDPTSWQPATTLDVGAGTTYNNIHYLPDDNGGAGRTYNFTRANNFDPVVQVSDDDGTTWSTAGKLLTQGGGNDRPYLRYASDGKRIHFIATEEHPRDFPNSVYHGYIEDGVLYDSSGSQIDGNLFDFSGVSPTELTPVFNNGSQFGGTTLNRAWTIDMELDRTGNPVGIISARANDSNTDHRFLYARYDGAAWQVNELAAAGDYLYSSETDYTGLVSIDPDNPNVVYVSTEIDPRNGSPTSNYELYKGVTNNFGSSWSWTAVTENSTSDNLRPVVPQWNGQDTTVLWMRGDYNSYTQWSTEVVGVQLAAADPKSLLWRGNAANAQHWDANTTANWDNGGGLQTVYQQGDEVAFDDSADTFQVELQAAMSPMGVAFNNAANDYTVSGAGISGAGNLRVIGGGNVTLANGNNTYTGETLIARGTLALDGTTALSQTPHIRVLEQGTFDVSQTTTGSYTLANQQITIDGDVLGNLHATDDSVVNINSTQSLHGNLVAQASIVKGAGRITGDLTVQGGTVLQVGEVELSAEPISTPVTYLDASSGAGGNTMFADGSVFNPPLNGTTGVDNHWEQRTSLGTGGNIFESSGEVTEDAETLRTTITGLTADAQYVVTVFFWDPVGAPEDWNIRAGFDTGDLTLFANGTASDAQELGAVGAGLASDLSYASSPPLFTEDNRTMIAGQVGMIAADSNGEIQVYLDDMPATLAANQRTWYDGLGIQQLVYPTDVVVNLTIEGSYTQSADSMLKLEVLTPGVLDRLDVAGTLVAGGTLQVTLAAGAPVPELGDAFDILDFNTATGSFTSFDLPVLESGLAWNVSHLLSSGILEVVTDVDLDDNGFVDGGDFLIIQRTNSSLIPTWQEMYGSQLVTPGAPATFLVPEPSTLFTLCLAIATGSAWRGPR